MKGCYDQLLKNNKNYTRILIHSIYIESIYKRSNLVHNHAVVIVSSDRSFILILIKLLNRRATKKSASQWVNFPSPALYESLVFEDMMTNSVSSGY